MRPRARLSALALAAALAGIGSARADSGPVPLRRIALGEPPVPPTRRRA